MWIRRPPNRADPGDASERWRRGRTDRRNCPTTRGGDIGAVPVTKVVDGDTVWVQREGRKVKLRLIGIDTPETHDPRKPVQCFGQAATARAQSMLAGHRVLLETDDSQGLLDKYGRELVYVWVDGQLFNLEMIKAGFAHEYTYDRPYRYQQQFRNAERAAAAAGAGLWSNDTCAGDTTRAAGG